MIELSDLVNGLTLAYEGDERYGASKCMWCGITIVECGFADCEFYNWVHIEGSRRGSHKCGKQADGVILVKSAMPAGYVEDDGEDHTNQETSGWVEPDPG